MIYRQLMQVLEAEGLKAMDPVGQPFDPALHQAVMQVPSSEYEEGVVVEVLQTGYWLKDKVLRPAMVKVSGG
jgi:molecular chaperone GrpE